MDLITLIIPLSILGYYLYDFNNLCKVRREIKEYETLGYNIKHCTRSEAKIDFTTNRSEYEFHRYGSRGYSISTVNREIHYYR